MQVTELDRFKIWAIDEQSWYLLGEYVIRVEDKTSYLKYLTPDGKQITIRAQNGKIMSVFEG